jgi:stringent starvation protein B
MTSSTKPYLIRSIFDWCTDSNFTPLLNVKITRGVIAPKNYVESNEIVFNLSLDSVSKLIFDNNFVSFAARFNGKNEDIFLPMESIAGIYSKQNGQGIFFKVDENNSEKKDKNKKLKTKKSHLSLVK